MLTPKIFSTQAEGVRLLSIAVGLVCILLGILPAIFCKEIDQSHLENRSELSFNKIASALKELFLSILKIGKNVPFVRLCGATFLVFNGFQMVGSFSYFIIVFYLFKGDYSMAGTWLAWFSTISALATAFLVIPIISVMANKWGKRNAFIISTFISIIGYVLKWWCFSPSNPWLMFVSVPFMAFGIGGLFTLMMSMTADVCDLDELDNGMPRKEGTFGAVYWWMVKLGQGLALMLGGFVLEIVGFQANAKVQTEATLTYLRLADIIIPATTALLAVLVMWNYDLSEDKAKAIKAELERRRGKL